MWNDAGRLSVFGVELARALADRGRPVRWVIADDGSVARERERLVVLQREFAEVYGGVELYFADRHRGKGAVVREAWSLVPEADWLAFVDADGSIAAGEFLELIETAVAADRSAIAVRVNTESTRVEASVMREVLHHAYLALARVILNLRSADLQCGGKVMRAADYRLVVGDLREEGFAFDSEMLAALQRRGLGWDEVAVNWVGKKGGKVSPLRDGLAMVRALLRIRRRLAAAD